jgi:hypothetical protein
LERKGANIVNKSKFKEIPPDECPKCRRKLIPDPNGRFIPNCAGIKMVCPNFACNYADIVYDTEKEN